MSGTADILEDDFLRTLIDTARTFGYKVAHFRPAKTNKGWRTPVQADGKGYPDLSMAKPGRLIFVEAKRDKGKLSPEQEAWRDVLLAAGAEFYVWRPRDWPAPAEILLRKPQAEAA